MRTELVFGGILPANDSFQCGERLILLQKVLFSYVGETHMFSKRMICVRSINIYHMVYL
jgi:hypothetical protein